MSHELEQIIVRIRDAHWNRNIRSYESCEADLRKMLANKEEAKKKAEEEAKMWETKYKESQSYQLEIERNEAVSKYDEALKTIETKSVQIENVNNEIKRMKRKFKDLCTSDTKMEEKSNALEKESDEVSQESDETVITSEWKYFHEQFQKLHNNLTSILHKTAEARNSNVLLENMKIVKELSDIAEVVKCDYLKTTKQCSANIKEVLERLFPSDSNSEDEAQNQDEKRDCRLLD